MKKNFFRNLIFSTALSFIFFSALVLPASAEPTIDVTKVDYRPEITVDIGGFNTKDDFAMPSKTSCKTGEEGCVSISWLASYIAVIYQYGIGLAGILAAVMILVGGFLWVSSFGSPDRISKAKEFITGALTGLLLALFSYLILFTLNPNLVKNESLVVSGVKPIDMVSICCQKSDGTYGKESMSSGMCASGQAPVSDDLCKPNQQICEEKGGIYLEESSWTTVQPDAHLERCTSECSDRNLTASTVELMGPSTRSGYKVCCFCGTQDLGDPVGCCYERRITGYENWVCLKKSLCEGNIFWTRKFKEINQQECSLDYCKTLNYD